MDKQDKAVQTAFRRLIYLMEQESTSDGQMIAGHLKTLRTAWLFSKIAKQPGRATAGAQALLSQTLRENFEDEQIRELANWFTGMVAASKAVGGNRDGQ